MKTREAIAIVDELITREMERSNDEKMKDELQRAWNKIKSRHGWKKDEQRRKQ